MSISAVATCNMALRKNHDWTVLPSDALTNPVGKPAQVCADWYDAARKAVYRMAPWTCVAVRRKLACENSARLTAYAVGDLVVAARTGPAYAVYKCTVAGTTAAGAPTWPASGTVADGTVTWTHQFDTKADLLAEHFTGYAYQFPLPKDHVRQVDFCDSLGEDIDAMIERDHAFSDTEDLVLRYVPDETDTTKWDSLLDMVMMTMVASMISYALTGSHENEMKFAQEAQFLVDAAEAESLREHKQGAPIPEQWAPGLFGNRQRKAT